MTNNITSRLNSRSRGVALIVVLVVVILSVVLTVTFNTAQSTSRGITQNADEHRQARNIAESGMDMALAHIRSDANWRHDLTNGTWVNGQTFAGGRFTITGLDGDLNLADDLLDPVSLSATGTFGNVSYTVHADVHPIKRLLMIVRNANNLTTAEQSRADIFRQEGWLVIFLSDSASQSEYDAQFVHVSAVFVSGDASPANVNTKLRGAAVGVVSELPTLADDMGLTSAEAGSTLGNLIRITNNTHAITTGFALSNLSVLGLLQPVNTYNGTLAPGVITLATHSLTGTPTMIAIDAGNTDFGDRFVIEGGQIVPQIPFAARITVVGAAITSGSFTVPVTTKLRIQNAIYEPWGSFGLGLTGNVNDNHNPRNYIAPNIYPALTPISVAARSWLPINSSLPVSNTNLAAYMTVDSHDTTPQVMVLRDGDPVPSIAGFNNQSSIEQYVREYINTTTHKIALAPNQAIFLFELGTTNLSSSAADFQDLVVLITLAADPTGFGSGSMARGRRVFLPWGGAGFNPTALTTSGRDIVDRAINWAGGGKPSGYNVRWLEQQ